MKEWDLRVAREMFWAATCAERIREPPIGRWQFGPHSLKYGRKCHRPLFVTAIHSRLRTKHSSLVKAWCQLRHGGVTCRMAQLRE